MLHSTQVVI